MFFFCRNLFVYLKYFEEPIISWKESLNTPPHPPFLRTLDFLIDNFPIGAFYSTPYN